MPLLNETNDHRSQLASSVQRTHHSWDRTSVNFLLQPHTEERRFTSAVMEEQMKSAEESVSKSVCIQVHTPHQKDACGNKERSESTEISSFQTALLYLRSVRNELEYDSRILERLRDGCIAYVEDYFAEILAMCTSTGNVRHYDCNKLQHSTNSHLFFSRMKSH